MDITINHSSNSTVYVFITGLCEVCLFGPEASFICNLYSISVMNV